MDFTHPIPPSGFHAPTFLQHPYVRDLWWILYSPPLFQEIPNCDPDIEWLSQGLNHEGKDVSMKLLQQLDQNPQPLVDYLHSKNYRKLGIYAELLVAFWLEYHPGYELLLTNLVIHWKRQTIGELDFVYREKISGFTVHLELAIKFYLGHGNTTDWMSWHGPNPIDKLGLKLPKLYQKQILMTKRPETLDLLAEKGIQIDARKILLKGCLYHHLTEQNPHARHVYPGYLHSFYVTESEVPLIDKRVKEWNCVSLPRLDWMASRLDTVGSQLLETWVAQPLKRPIQLAMHGGSRTKEYLRFFVVPDRWMERL
ncbi:MAG: DUF1853 family protein [Bacteroidota bacterium]